MARKELTVKHEKQTLSALESVRILDFGHIIAGPYATMLLAMFGADVIKVESRERLDHFRNALGQNADSSRAFEEYNRNKLSVTINMSSTKGREIVVNLVKVSDVVVENFRPGVMARWGLDYPSLKKINPTVIMCSLPGMGTTGPGSHYATWGPNLLSHSGFTYLWNHPDACGSGGVQVAYPDYVAGVEAAIAIMAALDYRARTGEGQFIEVAQVEGIAALLPTTFLEYFATAQEPKPKGDRSATAAPYGCYRCQGDDEWCVIAVSTDTQWLQFRRALGDPPWARKREFATVLGRLSHVDELNRRVEGWTRQHRAHEVMEVLQAHGIAAGAVQNAKDLFSDPNLRSHGMLLETNNPRLAGLVFPGIPIRLSRNPGKIVSHSPLLGQHNEYVLAELLGFSRQDINSLYLEGSLT